MIAISDPLRFRSLLAGALLALSCLGVAAQTPQRTHRPDLVGKQSWTQARVSSGLHSLNHAATVIHPPAPGSVPPGALITQVYANRDYAGQADVQTSLCWNGTERCIDITGRSVNSRAFQGLAADQPMYLVHRVRNWRDSPRPLYIRGNVTVWHGLPEAHASPSP